MSNTLAFLSICGSHLLSCVVTHVMFYFLFELCIQQRELDALRRCDGVTFGTFALGTLR